MTIKKKYVFYTLLSYKLESDYNGNNIVTVPDVSEQAIAKVTNPKQFRIHNRHCERSEAISFTHSEIAASSPDSYLDRLPMTDFEMVY